MAVKTQGTELYVLAPTASDPATFEILKVQCPTGVQLGNDTRNQIDTTCLDATDSESSLPGLKKPGTANVPINADPANISHVRLKALSDAGTVLKFASGWSDGTGTAPALNTAGDDFETPLPTSRSWNTFSGYIADFPFDSSLNSIVKTAMSIQRTTSVSWITKSA